MSSFQQLPNNQPNTSNLKVILRIRPPKSFEQQKDSKKQSQALQSPSNSKSYTCIRNRTRSSSRDMSSPLKHYQSTRNQSRESSGKRSGSNGKKGSLSKSGAGNSGCVQEDKKYCVFTTKERSNIAVASENPVPGKMINESLNDIQDLKYFNSQLLGNNQSFTFTFDSVFNESYKQEKFYSSSIRPSVKSFVEGENACILLFGPTESGKTHTLKGKTGMERGILPRAVEDIFNIVKNSEERDEEFEMFRNDMMNRSGEGQYMGSEGARGGRGQYGGDEQVPERMFLKICVYQIFVDKVIDLLSSSGTQMASHKSGIQKVQIDHYIDKESEEVVSKLKNITEKVVFTLEDFYSVLQEAFKNRRIESVSMQEQDLRKKTHFIISLTLMKRTPSKRLMEVSRLNFVELSGSEQAVAEEKFYMDSSVRQFVTKSFNSLSSQILKAALKKKGGVSQASDDGDSKVVNCLRNTLTAQSNIVLVCCVNPGPSYFEHSLPAIKFCARIRDCILKKLSRKPTTRTAPLTSHHNQSASIDEIEYNQETDRTGNGRSGQIDTTRDVINDIREQLMRKQQALARQTVSRSELEMWIGDQVRVIDRLTHRLRVDNQSGSRDRQNYIILDELQQLKDKIQKLPLDYHVPTQHSSSFGQSERFPSSQLPTHYHREAPLRQSEQPYNPFSTVDSFPDHHLASTLKNPYLSGVHDYPLSDRKYHDGNDFNSSIERKQLILSSQSKNEPGYYHQSEHTRIDTTSTPQFDGHYSGDSYQQYSADQKGGALREQNSHTKLTPRMTLQQQNQSKNQTYHREQPASRQYQGGLQNHFTSPRGDNNLVEIETILDSQAYNSQKHQDTYSQRQHQIKIYEQSEEPSKALLQESPKQETGFRQARGQRNTKQGGNTMQRVSQGEASCTENEFLNKALPLLDVSLTGENNNISTNQMNMSSTKAATTQQQQTMGGFRSGATGQNTTQKQGGNPGQSSVSLFGNSKVSQYNGGRVKSQYNSGLYTKVEMGKSMQQDFKDLSKQKSQLQSESVYQTEEEAMSDLTRLIKLNDLEGVKLRVLQIYKEKAEQDKLIEQIETQTHTMGEELERREQLISEYEKTLRENHQEYQINIEDLTNQKEDSVKEFGQKASSLAEQVHSLTLQINSLNEDRERIRQDNDMLKTENKEFLKLKTDAEFKFEKEKEQCDKFRANYDILKEHELSIIKDYEGKKTREIAFYEQTLADSIKQVKELQGREKELEEQSFRLREELRRNEFELEKSGQDRRHMADQIEKLGSKLEKEEEQSQQLLQQLDQNTQLSQTYQQQLQQLDSERSKAFEEIQKLHSLIEEMERSIQSEKEHRKQDHLHLEEKDKEMRKLGTSLIELDETLQKKDFEMQEFAKREADLQRELVNMGRLKDEAERSLTMLKAKEYDKVDVLRKVAELEAKVKYLQVDNESLVKERNNLDLANVDLTHKSDFQVVHLREENQHLSQSLSEANQELDYFRTTHEDLLDKFDCKIEQITTELSKMKNENIALKEKDKAMKKMLAEVEEERDEFREKYRIADRKSEDFNLKLFEMEREVRQMIQEREKEMKDSALRQTLELRNKEENKRQLLDDIQNLIKDKRKVQQKQGVLGGLSLGGGSLHNSTLN